MVTSCNHHPPVSHGPHLQAAAKLTEASPTPPPAPIYPVKREGSAPPPAAADLAAGSATAGKQGQGNVGVGVGSGGRNSGGQGQGMEGVGMGTTGGRGCGGGRGQEKKRDAPIVGAAQAGEAGQANKRSRTADSLGPSPSPQNNPQAQLQSQPSAQPLAPSEGRIAPPDVSVHLHVPGGVPGGASGGGVPGRGGRQARGRKQGPPSGRGARASLPGGLAHNPQLAQAHDVGSFPPGLPLNVAAPPGQQPPGHWRAHAAHPAGPSSPPPLQHQYVGAPQGVFVPSDNAGKALGFSPRMALVDCAVRDNPFLARGFGAIFL